MRALRTLGDDHVQLGARCQCEPRCTQGGKPSRECCPHQDVGTGHLQSGNSSSAGDRSLGQDTLL